MLVIAHLFALSDKSIANYRFFYFFPSYYEKKLSHHSGNYVNQEKCHQFSTLKPKGEGELANEWQTPGIRSIAH